MASRPDRPGLLFVTNRLQGSGVGQLVATKGEWLVQRGYRVEVLAWQVEYELSGQANPVLRTLAAAGIRVRDIEGRGRRLQLLRRAARVALVAARERFSIVVGHGTLGGLVAVLAKGLSFGRLRAVVEVQGNPLVYEREFSPKTIARTRQLYGLADGVSACAEGLRQQAIDYYRLRPERVVTIQNPVPVARVRELAREAPAPALRELGPFVLACGRISPAKRFPDLIRAFARVRRERPLKLVILGEGNRDGLSARAAAEGVAADVVFPGFTPNPFPYFAAARLFALTSEFEGFPLVLVEALACGTPVIASRCRWGPEELLENGKHGLLFDVGDVDGLADGLRRILDDPEGAARRARQGVTRAEAFSAEALMPRVEALYTGQPAGASGDAPRLGCRTPG